MQLEVNGAYIYFTIPVFGGISITQTTISSLIVTILLCSAFVYFGKRLKKRPDGKQVLVEKGVMMLHNLVVQTMGEHNAHWMPFIAAIFLSSICGSYIGLTGFLRSTTADVSTVLVWALMVTFIIWYQNIKHNGFLGWLKGFTQPIFLMTPMNIISEIAQPVSMAFRHFGNVAGGSVISSILYMALSAVSVALLNVITATGWLISAIMILLGACVIYLYTRKKKVFKLIFGVAFIVIGIFGLLQAFNLLPGVPILAYGIPAVLSCYFDLFSGFVQAFVFSLLSMAYIAAACPPPEVEKGQ